MTSLNLNDLYSVVSDGEGDDDEPMIAPDNTTSAAPTTETARVAPVAESDDVDGTAGDDASTATSSNASDVDVVVAAPTQAAEVVVKEVGAEASVAADASSDRSGDGGVDIVANIPATRTSTDAGQTMRKLMASMMDDLQYVCRKKHPRIEGKIKRIARAGGH